MMGVAALELTEGHVAKQQDMTDQWKAILAKDTQGNYIVKDPAVIANAGNAGKSSAAASLSTA